MVTLGPAAVVVTVVVVVVVGHGCVNVLGTVEAAVCG